MVRDISIDGRLIGGSMPPYIIAEMSGNHNGNIERAFEIIDMAKAMGADAIKFQTYTADTLTIDCDKDDFLVHGGLWDGYSLYKLYEWAHTPFEWHKDLFKYARKTGITCFSTPFDETAVDLLEGLGAPAYKVASFEAVDLSLVKYIAQTGKPMIISTGMANEEEIGECLDAAREGGCEDIILLHCISGYPAPVKQCNLRTIPDLASRFSVLSGLSDHTLGTTVSVAAVALGACVIEKHFTLSRKEKGPDSEFSLEPEELKRLCEDSKIAWESLGKSGYGCQPVEEASIKFRRSIYFVKDINAGEMLTAEHIRIIRPGYGLPPKYYQELIGRRVSRSAKFGDAVSWDIFS